MSSTVVKNADLLTTRQPKEASTILSGSNSSACLLKVALDVTTKQIFSQMVVLATCLDIGVKHGMDHIHANLQLGRLHMPSVLVTITRDASVISMVTERQTALKLKEHLRQSPNPILLLIQHLTPSLLPNPLLSHLLSLSLSGMTFKKSKTIHTTQMTSILAPFIKSTARWTSSRPSFTRSSQQLTRADSFETHRSTNNFFPN